LFILDFSRQCLLEGLPGLALVFWALVEPLSLCGHQALHLELVLWVGWVALLKVVHF